MSFPESLKSDPPSIVQRIRHAGIALSGKRTREMLDEAAISGAQSLIDRTSGVEVELTIFTKDNKYTMSSRPQSAFDKSQTELTESEQNRLRNGAPVHLLDSAAAAPQHIMMIPLIVGDHLGGTLSTHSTEAIDPATSEALQAFAIVLSTALERLSLSEELQRSELRYRAIVENSNDVVLIVDDRLRVRYASPSVKALLGLQPDDLAGKTLMELVHHDDSVRVREALDSASREADVREIGCRMRGNDGEWHAVAFNLRNVSDDPAIGGTIIDIRDVSARVHQDDVLRQLSLEDPLTKLANRALFTETLTRALARRGEPRIALLFFDLDGFKLVNDTHGHIAGDKVLVVTSERLRGCIRKPDLAARLGGDEFAVLLDDVTSEETAKRAAERVNEATGRPIDIKGAEVSVGISIGVAIAQAGDSVADLVQRADKAMYSAKRAGGSRVQIA